MDWELGAWIRGSGLRVGVGASGLGLWLALWLWCGCVVVGVWAAGRLACTRGLRVDMPPPSLNSQGPHHPQSHPRPIPSRSSLRLRISTPRLSTCCGSCTTRTPTRPPAPTWSRTTRPRPTATPTQIPRTRRRTTRTLTWMRWRRSPGGGRGRAWWRCRVRVCVGGRARGVHRTQCET